MKIGLFNAWFLSFPLVVIFAYISVFHKDAARRLGDMTGYTAKEKATAVSASLAPYPFMVLTLFTPLSSNAAAVLAGSFLYGTGLTGFILSVIRYTKTDSGEPATQGIYRISRNPMYVSAFFTFAGITVMTLDRALAVLLVAIILLNHGMIRAEEAACARRFGEVYKRYARSTPRYLFIR